MSEQSKKVAVFACSGMGKPLGAVAREIGYELTERVRPDTTVLTCLALLVIGDPEARRLVTENPVIAIDGCVKDCAKKSIEAQGAKIVRAYQSIDFFKKHSDLKPEGIAELNEAGKKLAALAADELAGVVDELLAEEAKND
jgi:uncharacterized metal-binding protein